MGVLIRFPQERVDYSFPPVPADGATIFVLPLVRIKGGEPDELMDKTIKALDRMLTPKEKWDRPVSRETPDLMVPPTEPHEPLLSEKTFAHVVRSFEELHEVFGPPF